MGRGVFGQSVEIGVAADATKDGDILQRCLPTPLACQRASYGIRAAGHRTCGDQRVDEGDQVIWYAHGDLRGHPIIIPIWDHVRPA
nr:hypothetical protein [Frankia canadensis]